MYNPAVSEFAKYRKARRESRQVSEIKPEEGQETAKEAESRHEAWIKTPFHLLRCALVADGHQISPSVPQPIRRPTMSFRMKKADAFSFHFTKSHLINARTFRKVPPIELAARLAWTCHPARFFSPRQRRRRVTS